MLQFDTKGIYCRQAGVYIDPWQPVDKALITHAHSDHARSGSKAYLCHHNTVPLLKLRLGQEINVEGIGYGEPVFLNGVRISFHPAGHIIGSAQIRLEYQGVVWVVSGDYKLQEDGISAPFEPLRCHHFITESTFGLPVYRFPAPEEVYKEINDWWQQNAADGQHTVIIGYALGKAQRIIRHLDSSIGPVLVHGAVDNVNTALAANGVSLNPSLRITPELSKDSMQDAVIVAPPSAIGSPWLKRFLPYRLGICSGWMQLRGARRRRSADRGFILSDHADWPQLNEAIKATGAEHIYVTHGYKSIFARWLREEMGLQAFEVDTLYEAEGAEDTEDILPP
ncbi:ligase-associated DNA damage response exonuclease [Taibaiella koreensis]|uniref:ligase-associated DNA damage response exonuclease n=1 Tax=Taibaiella koreensis TaxID=1268548 RepID=UPI000E59AB24|nr:ligase-associated DNA damage response exonuclease [Taibaiella koreensis]